MKDPLKPYRKWRKQVAKEFNCTEAAIELAIEEGRQILGEKHASKAPTVQALYATYRDMPMYLGCFTAYLYSRNPLLKMLMTRGI